jgi:hypothetical protein
MFLLIVSYFFEKGNCFSKIIRTQEKSPREVSQKRNPAYHRGERKEGNIHELSVERAVSPDRENYHITCTVMMGVCLSLISLYHIRYRL